MQRHRPELSEALTGERLVGHRRSARTFAANRVCDHRGCTTRLSIYNSGTLCAVHSPFRSVAADAVAGLIPEGEQRAAS